MELSRSYNVNNNLGITKGEREWHLDYDGDFEKLTKTNVGSLQSIDRTIFGQIANGDRIVIFRNGKRTGKCATILSGSNDKCICFTYPEEQEVFILSKEGARLGTLSITEPFDNYRGFVDEIYIVPLGHTTNDTQINFEIDEIDKSITVGANTPGGSLLPLGAGVRYISKELKAIRNAETADRTECVLFAVCERSQKSDMLVIPGVGEKVACFETEDIGNFTHSFLFDNFVRVKGFAIVPLQGLLVDVTFQVTSVEDTVLTGVQMVLPQDSEENEAVFGCFVSYVTKGVKFGVTVGVASETKAKVYVIYEEVGNCVHYQWRIPNANLTTTPFVCPDRFNATIKTATFYADSADDIEKGAFAVSLSQPGGVMAQNVDCYRRSVSPRLLRNVLTPTEGVIAANIATGGATSPVIVFIDFMLQ